MNSFSSCSSLAFSKGTYIFLVLDRHYVGNFKILFLKDFTDFHFHNLHDCVRSKISITKNIFLKKYITKLNMEITI